MRNFSKIACAVIIASAAAVFVLTAQQTEPAHATTNGDCTLVIHVTGARNAKGGIGGLLFNSTDGWPENRDKAVAHGTFPITGSESTLTFDKLVPGEYGVVVLHDENLNKKLDRNFLTIPKEGYGFGNNPKVGLSAPKMKVASVNVNGPVTKIEIKLAYK